VPAKSVTEARMEPGTSERRSRCLSYGED
jgi:hypothetical protein